MPDPSKETKSSSSPEPIKVLIVEDSPTVSRLLMTLFGNDPTLQVVGVARDGAEAIRLTSRLRPNVITMDVHMPNMDGLEATEYIMAHHPTPILVLTASLGKQDVDLGFKMLSAGALEIIEKPAAAEWQAASRTLIERVKLLSRIKVITHVRGKSRFSTRLDDENPVIDTPPITTKPKLSRATMRENAPTAPLNPATLAQFKIPAPQPFNDPDNLRGRKFTAVAIAASTGGPPALSKLLGAIPANFPLPLLVIQHIPIGFSTGLAEWLNGETPLKVKNTEDGEVPRAGFVYLSGDDRHLGVGLDGRRYLNEEPARLGLRPSADVTFEGMAKAWPGKTLAVVLTGMGRDGTAGMRSLKSSGGYNIAQDETSSVIFGMPKSAIEAQVVDKILSLNEIAPYLKGIFSLK
jgi:two-component system chemotaxis response regulator CheB